MAVPVERLNSPLESRMHDPFALVGEIVSGRFRVLSVRHVGPRSAVYEVEPPGVGQMRRALKVVNVAEAREPDVAERLRTVARAMRDLDHPFLERIFDLGHLPDETPFVVAEWLPHPTLERALEHGRRLPAVTSLELLLRATKACAALHERGVVHGDIRPSHLLVDLLGDEPSDIRGVKLVDAGVPGVLNCGPLGGAAGQVAYLAPECLAGQPRSPASDVYALGVLGYRLLTQLLPYRPEDPRAGREDRDPVSRVRWLHQNASPLRPSRLITPPDFSPEVEAVLGRAMAKSLVERYPDAGAFFQALEQAVSAPPLRGPGAVAVPITEELPTEGTAPEMPAVEPGDEAAVGDAVPTAPATVEMEPPPSFTGMDEWPASGTAAAAPAGLPYWVWALAGVGTGVAAALLS